MTRLPALSLALSLLLSSAAALLGTACTGVRAKRPNARAHAPVERITPSAPARLWTANELAEALGNAQECEAHARHLLAKDGDKAWALLSACVRRRHFTDLGRLTSPPWLEHVQRRAEGALLLARVIAERGGDVHKDLTLLQRRRLPIFSLRAALEDPETYAGRLLIMRGRATRARARGEGRALLVRETNVVAVPERIYASVESRARGPRVVVNEGALRNVSEETGDEILLRTRKADPFLEPHSDYVFLVRFDAAQPAFDADTSDVTSDHGIASVVAAFAPTRGRFEYAAHR